MTEKSNNVLVSMFVCGACVVLCACMCDVTRADQTELGDQQKGLVCWLCLTTFDVAEVALAQRPRCFPRVAHRGSRGQAKAVVPVSIPPSPASEVELGGRGRL